MRSTSIEILYEDDVLIAVNKPPGMLVHHGRDDRPDLQRLVQEHLGREVVLFHRLDRGTSGVVLLGKQRSINAAMSQAFERKRIRKAYWAVVAGCWRPEWNRIETRIDRDPDGGYRNVVAGGRPAISTCRLLGGSDDKSWLEVLPKTGRSHQVRLHCLALGHPILGDRVYGERTALPLALHAWRVDFRHPLSGEPLRIRAAAPSYWRRDLLAGIEVDPRWAAWLP